MNLKSSLRLPKEHGAWAMLYVPMIVGVLVAATFPIRVIALIMSSTFLFIARESLIIWWRGRSRGQNKSSARLTMFIYLGAAAILAAPLIFVSHLYWLIPAAVASFGLLAINAGQSVRHEDRSVAGETIAIAGLTMTAPMAYYVARGEWDVTAIWLWAMCALYFLSSVFYVKLRVYSISARKEQARRQTWWNAALYHACLLAGLVVLAITGKVGLFALVGFAPVLGRTFWFMARPAHKVNLKRIGVFEIVYSLVFLVFITLNFHSW